MEQILRIDMLGKTCRYEPLSAAYRRLGGRALTSRIVRDEVDPTCDPLGPTNKLVFAPGLLSGTVASSSSRISIGCKSPLTGGIKEANGGGNTGWRLAQHGLRAVIVEGQPAEGEWLVAVIEGGGCRLEPATELVGLGTYDASVKLREKYGEKAGLAIIGQAGEQRMMIAGICNTDPEGRPSRICARGAVGAVMGSKGLKALVVLDPGANVMPERADMDLWKQGSREYVKQLVASPVTDRFKQLGTAATLEGVHKMGGLPVRNFSQGQHPKAEAIGGIRMAEMIKERGGMTSHSCMSGCAIQCSNVWVDKEKREVASSMEFESNIMFGSNLDIYDFDVIARSVFLCNDLGADSIETGAAIGVAMQAGLLPFGDAGGVLDLFEQMKNGTILGRLIGSGAAAVGRAFGVREVPAVKGQAMAAYDPRAIKGNGVTYATSPMGGDHTAGNTIPAQTDQRDPVGKVKMSREWQIGATVQDMLGLCIFTRGVYANGQAAVEAMISARLGEPVTMEQMRRLGQETIKLEIAYNRAAGLGPATDRIPEWMRTTPLAPTGAVWDIPDEELDAIWEMD